MRSVFDTNGGWPYGSHDLTREHMAEALRPALPHVDEVLAIPAIYLHDTLQTNPRAWLRDMLAKHIATDIDPA